MTNQYTDNQDGTISIWCPYHGGVIEAIIDAKNLPLADWQDGTWYGRQASSLNGNVYISTTMAKNSITTPTKSVHLHRVVMGEPPAAKQVDHRNHQGWDNRESNLEVVSPSENEKNRLGPTTSNKSEVRGVSYSNNVRSKKRWRVKLCGERGSFKTKEEAVAYAEIIAADHGVTSLARKEQPKPVIHERTCFNEPVARTRAAAEAAGVYELKNYVMPADTSKVFVLQDDGNIVTL